MTCLALYCFFLYSYCGIPSNLVIEKFDFIHNQHFQISYLVKEVDGKISPTPTSEADAKTYKDAIAWMRENNRKITEIKNCSFT